MGSDTCCLIFEVIEIDKWMISVPLNITLTSYTIEENIALL